LDTNTRCVQCGQPRRVGQRFCSNCGLRLDATRELKQASVLLADLCDSTAQVVASGTEDGQAYLESAYQIMSEAVAHFGGAQIQWRGDELLALFGAPVAQEDHAVNACLAALRIVQRLAERATDKTPMAVRIGVDSGEVLIGPGVPGLGARYSADGSAIHLAARLERLAAPGTALISASTRRLAEHRIDTLALGERAVRGFDKPAQVFQLVAELNRALQGRRRHLAPLLGRDNILAELEAAVRATRGAGMRIVGLRGDAGVGKSRLLEEMCKGLEASCTAFVSVGARQAASEVPYGVAADLLRALVTLGPARYVSEPAVLDLLDQGDPGDAWRALSPALRRRRIIDVVAGLMVEITRSGPLVVVIDDVFLSDADTLRLLDALARPLAGQPVLLLLTYRTEFVHRWGEAPWFTERMLAPLAADGMGQLADALLGRDTRLLKLQHTLLERADGNPFFFEQMVLMLVDQGSVAGQPGDYRLTTEPDKIGVPASVVATIASQVDRLSPETKRALEAGAVVGDPFDPGVIAAMLGIDVDALRPRLRAAASAGLLADTTGAGAGTRAFRHALVRETIYSALPRQRRADLHRAAYGAIRASLGEHIADAAHVLARHAYLGCDWASAAEYSLASMKRSTARSANRDALRGFERGLEAAGRIAEPRAQLSSELALRMAALGPMMAMGQLDGIVTNLERAETIAHTLGDTRSHAAVLLQLAVSFWTRGNYRQGLDAAGNADRAARQAGSRSLQMAALQARLMLHHALGRYADAAEDAALVESGFAAELAARRLLPGWAVVAIVNLRAFKADLMALEGRFAEAQLALDEAYAELAAQEHAFSRVLVDFVQAGVMLMTARAQDAAALLQSARELCRTQDVATMLPPIVARLAGALAADGRAAEALQLIEPAIEQKLHLVGGRYNDFYFPYYHALALWAAGCGDEAARSAEAAVVAATSFEQHAHAAGAQLLAGRIALSGGHTAQARAHLEAARALALQCHMPWLVREVAALRTEGGAYAA
jgi:class 3 adenylate cyclase